jgi:hypothetical protein
MKTRVFQILFLGLVSLLVQPGLSQAQDDNLYSFDVEEFTKKTWEWKGGISVSGTEKIYNKDSVIYPVKFQDETTQSEEGELNLSLESRWDWDWSRLFLSGEATALRSSISDNDDESSYLAEAYWQLSVLDPHNLEIGKRLLRWGKGYAFNPVALMERAKNPEDPEASREGLWIVQGIAIPGAFSFFDSSSLTLVYLPIREDVNDDYQIGVVEENTWGLKVYFLIGLMDIDLYLVERTEAEEMDWGLDFATNITPSFEVHGEFAVRESTESADSSALLGMRFISESEITWIAELYQDSAGLTESEARDLYELIDSSPPSRIKPYLAQIQQKKTLTQHYGYIKASIKEPFDWLYFTPSFSWLGNLDDASSNNTIQLTYSPSDNWTYQFSWQHLTGGEYTQYGESLVMDKLEIALNYSF